MRMGSLGCDRLTLSFRQMEGLDLLAELTGSRDRVAGHRAPGALFRSITRRENSMTDPSMTSEPVLLEKTRNGVRILRMNRPEKKNALSNDLTRALVRSVEEAASDDEG
jgi:hypothetical protein